MGVLDKLKDVLFEKDEDEEEYEDEYEDEVIDEKPVRKEPAKVTQPPVFSTKVEEKPQPSVINSVELTQPVPAVNPSKPVFNETKPASTFAKPQMTAPLPETPKPEPVNSGFNLLADEPSNVPPVKPEKKKPASNTGVYEFKPVISPMFGVDDKDMDAIQTSSRLKPEEAHGVSKIISPIYGVSEEAKPTSIQRTVEKSNYQETIAYNHAARTTEDAIPEFSLDDILNARDEEYARETAAMRSNAAANADVDETVVIDSRNMNPFGTDDHQ